MNDARGMPVGCQWDSPWDAPWDALNTGRHRSVLKSVSLSYRASVQTRGKLHCCVGCCCGGISALALEIQIALSNHRGRTRCARLGMSAGQSLKCLLNT